VKNAKQLLALIAILIGLNTYSNKRASEIYIDLQKLHSLKRVLYIAAHPDDENTKLLAYFSLGDKAETAYLSLTRGDGGQNLIGDELSEKLGVLRTQELLAARSYDRAIQFFTRAVDFGYSKTAEESLKKWGHDELLSDVVRIIRQFRPDVIITRFPPDRRGGHGHHTASAMLAIEAFEKAADPNYLPTQVMEVGTWQTTSLYWNTSYWWMKDIADSVAKYPDKYLTKDISGYNPLLGMSYNEIGSIARSQHKCQGFGAIVERGPRTEYFEHFAGEKLDESFFEKKKDSWTDIINADFEKYFDKFLTNFDFIHPKNNLESLLYIQKNLSSLPESPFKNEKITLCNEIIINSLGLYIEALADDFMVVRDDSASFSINALGRIKVPIEVLKISVNQHEISNYELSSEKDNHFKYTFKIKNRAPYTQPYWLKNPFENLFQVTESADLGKAQGAPTFNVELILLIGNQKIVIERPIIYKWREPSSGEKRREVISSPIISCNFESPIEIMRTGERKRIRILVRSFSDSISETITINTPKGWTSIPNQLHVEFDKTHSEEWFEFELEAGDAAENGEITLSIEGLGKAYSYEEIAYDHIPTQTLQTTAKTQCIALDAKIVEGKIAYIKGVKDAVPSAISQLGFEIDQFEVEDLSQIDLTAYQSVVLGIRIYNVHPELSNHHEKLYEYVKNGGNLIMQYNTASRSRKNNEFGPLPFKLSRNRVTEEDAVVTILNSDHPIMTFPNKISAKDFEDWVQERGLYFAGEWDEKYEALLSWHDTGEDAKEGGLIVLKYGKGQFVYTGISFFRELPKGVIGAYRLFANILSYKHE
jgi:LmbE family N-acetylglucosaminyl deacetylase